MSYDLESLHLKYGVQYGSVRFSSSTDLAGTTVIAAVAGATPVIHQISWQASAFGSLTLGRATGGATTYWQGLGATNNVPTVEPCRIPCDVSGSVILEGGAGIGSGVFHIYYVYQRAPVSGGAGVGNL